MTLFHAVLGLVALQRALELAVAASNTRYLRRRGGVESDAGGYPWLVALHAGWLAALLAAVPAAVAPCWPLLGAFAVLQCARLWVIATLGRAWTTRIITMPGTPLKTHGPYRWVRHPNYAIVAGEILLLPLAFGAPGIALLFTAANLVLLARRIAVEDRALAPLRCNTGNR